MLAGSCVAGFGPALSPPDAPVVSLGNRYAQGDKPQGFRYR